MNPHVAGSLWGAGKPSEVISAPLSRNIDTVNTLEAKKSNIGVQRPRVLGGGTISPSKRESTSRVGIPRVTSVRARARPFTPKTHRRQVVHGRDAKVSPVGDVRPAGKKLAYPEGHQENYQNAFALPTAHSEPKSGVSTFVLSQYDRKGLSNVPPASLPFEAMTRNTEQKVNVSKFKVAPASKLSKLTFHYDPPVETCTLTPYFLIEDTEGNMRPRDPRDDVRFRWYRGQRCVCAICGKRGIMQCLTSLKAGIEVDETFFCSNQCLQINFKRKKNIFNSGPAAARLSQKWDSDPTESGRQCGDDKEAKANSLFSKMPPSWKDQWMLINKARSYVPRKIDVGRRLRLDAAVTSEKTGERVWSCLHTTSVMRAPSPPPPRRLLGSENTMSQPTFKVFCYNVLADIYATGYMYPYCPLWALQWSYRCERILRSILSTRAEIICLQEVQEDHFKKFFVPNLSKNGYDGIYKRKTRESRTSNPDAVDGCAIFYERNRFALRERHDIEFNKLADMHIPDRGLLRRMSKGNIGQILLLEELGKGGQGHGMICVGNTHIYWDPEYKDVKLWQTFMLIQQLQSHLQHRKHVPLILCGDFNSEVDSAVYKLLSERYLRTDHPILKDSNAQKMLSYYQSFDHTLPLESAYAAIGEPKYTNYTGHYIGTLDYIWYSNGTLRPVAILEIDDEKHLKKQTALPSPQYPSDHIFLLAEFAWN